MRVRPGACLEILEGVLLSSACDLCHFSGRSTASPQGRQGTAAFSTGADLPPQCTVTQNARNNGDQAQPALGILALRRRVKWDQNLEFRSFSHHARHIDAPAMVFDDPTRK